MTRRDGVEHKMSQPQTSSSSWPSNGIDLSAPKNTQFDKHGSKIPSGLNDSALKLEQINLEGHGSNHPGVQLHGHNNSHATEPLRASPSTEMEKKPTNLITTESDSKPSHKAADITSCREAALSDIKGPRDFIKNLLSLEGRHIFYAVDYDPVSREVCICKDKKAEYTLFRSMHTLDHDHDLVEGQRDDEFRCLVYASDPKIDNQRVAFHCYEDLRRYYATSSEQVSDKLVLARFVPLGWLRKSSLEADKDPTLKHITNYVVLWNTSTNPHSLWICYDYYRPNFDGCGRRRKLGKPTYYNAEEDDEFGPQGCAFPLEENTDPDDEIPGDRDIVLYDGYDDPYKNEPDDYELVRPVPAKTPLLLANDAPSESQNRNPGYFNTEKPFDLAVLAVDIKQWDGEVGLDPASMHDCLRVLRFRLGDALRARPWVSTV